VTALDRQTELFLQRAALTLIDAGEDPTEANMVAAMKRVIERDEEIFVWLLNGHDAAERERMVKEHITRAAYQRLTA